MSKKIARARLAKGLSQAALARLLGVSRSAVNQWEGGTVTNIEVRHRIALSEHLDIPITDLLPPGAASGEIVIRDPQKKLLLERFDAMSPPQREAYLRLLLVMGESAPPSDPQH